MSMRETEMLQLVTRPQNTPVALPTMPDLRELALETQNSRADYAITAQPIYVR